MKKEYVKSTLVKVPLLTLPESKRAELMCRVEVGCECVGGRFFCVVK